VPEAVQESEAELLPGVMVSVGVVGAAQPAKLAPGSVVQAMPCRLKAAKRAALCGVPFERLPSMTFHQLPVPQPFEVKGVVAWAQVKELVAVFRERYQRRSRVGHASRDDGHKRRGEPSGWPTS
jgi:hypothetical protein